MIKYYKIFRVIIIIGIIFILFFICNFLLTTKVTIINNSVVTLKYNYEGDNISTELTAIESHALYNMFEGKDCFFDSGLSCPFNSEIKIIFGKGVSKTIFYPACDGNYVIKYKGKIFYLTDEEGKKFHSVLNKYGISFPCL